LAVCPDGKPFSNLHRDRMLPFLQRLKLFQDLVHEVDHKQILDL